MDVRTVIEGPVVRLRPIEERDLSEAARWRSEPEVERFWGKAPDTEAGLREELLEPDEHAPTHVYVIEHEGRGIGCIQYWHRYPGAEEEWLAGIDIFIGVADGRDRGLGTEAVRTMLRYLFEERGVHRVTIDPEVDNARGIRCYEKAGFRLEGVLRHNDQIDGRYVDTHFMGILADEWPEARARWEAEHVSSNIAARQGGS